MKAMLKDTLQIFMKNKNRKYSQKKFKMPSGTAQVDRSKIL